MKKDRKVKIVEQLKDKLAGAKSLVLTDYRGLTHRQLEEIKKALKQAGAEFVVTKNTLLKRAMEHGTWNMEHGELTGPTATLFSYQDEIAPLSVLAKFIKNFGLPQIKIGILGEKVLSSEEILRLAFLPPREALMQQMAWSLKNPIIRLHRALTWNPKRLTIICKYYKSERG